MVLCRYALRICIIACISVATQGHVLLAVNVEDFKNLANQFLSKSLAQKLSHLVSETAGANRRDDSRSDPAPDIDLNQVAELIRDKILMEYKTTVSSTKKTHNPNIKRFNTVQNTVDTTRPPKITKRILRDPNYDSPGLVYVKDDVQNQLQNYDEQPNKYDTIKPDYFETSPNESEEKTVSREPTNAKGSLYVKEKNTEHQDDTHKKMDYTEAKLGEWLYNHVVAPKSTKLQNQKNSIMDINDVRNANKSPDESENIKNVQYVYSLSGHDKNKQKIENLAKIQLNKDTNHLNLQDQQEDDTNNDYIMGPKLNFIYKKKPQKQLTVENYSGIQIKHQEIENQLMDKRDYVKSIQGNRNTFNQESIALDQAQLTGEQDTINESIMGPKKNTIYKKTPQKQRIDENYSGLQTKHQKTVNQVMDKRDSVKPIEGNKNKFNQENIALIQGQQTGEQDTINESIMRPKQNTVYKKKPQKQQTEENYSSVRTKHQEIESQVMDKRDYVKTIQGNKNTFDQDSIALNKGQQTGQQDTINESIMRLKQNTVYKKKPHTPQIEENYSGLQSKHQEIENQVMDKRDYVKLIQGNKNTLNQESIAFNQGQETGEQNTINESNMRLKHNTVYKKKPHKQQIEENYTSSQTKDKEIENLHSEDWPEYVKPILGNKNTFNKENFAFDQGEGRLPTNLDEPKQEPIKIKIVSSLYDADEGKPQSMEKHIMYDKYVLGSKDKESIPKEPHRHLVRENYELGQETKIRNNNRADRQQVDNSDERLMSDIQKAFYGNTHEVDDRSTHDQLLLSNKKLDPDTKNSNKHHHLSDKKVKSDFIKSKIESSVDDTIDVKDRKEEKYIMPTTANYTHREKPQKQSIEDTLETYALSFETKNKKLKNFTPQSDDSYVPKKPSRSKHRYDDDSDKDKEFSNKKQSIIKNTKRSSITVAKHELTTKAPMKKEKFGEHSLLGFESAKLGSSSDEIQDKQVKEQDTSNKYKLGKHEETSNKQATKENDKYDITSTKYKYEKHKDTFKKQAMEENATYEEHSPDRKRKNKSKFKKQPLEENGMYEIYSLGPKQKSKGKELNKDDDSYGHEETVLGKRNKARHGRDKDYSDNNDEMLLNNKNRHLLKATKKGKGSKHEEVPSEGYADDPRPDFKEVKPENIKGKTIKLLDSIERKGKQTKRFTMKGTLIPKREFYKLSSPNYYKDLPRTVDKYDFSEPIPEQDRERDRVRYLKREPARVNRKLKLPKYEKIT